MTRINAVRNIAATRSSVTRNSVTWGSMTWGKNAGALIFAAALIVCSLTVGCSSDKDKPKPVANNIQIPTPPAPSAMTPMPAPAAQAAAKPISDKRGTIEYRTKIAGVLARRTAQIAFDRAAGKSNGKAH